MLELATWKGIKVRAIMSECVHQISSSSGISSESEDGSYLGLMLGSVASSTLSKRRIRLDFLRISFF